MKEQIGESEEKGLSGSTDEDFRAGPLVKPDDVQFWVREQVPLLQCLCVAMSLHVILLPVMWIMGWALPWPKPPVITTIVEYDLSDWPRKATPKKVLEIVDPDLNQ